MTAAQPTCLTVQVTLSIRRKPGRKTVVTPDGSASTDILAHTIPTRADPTLVKALARAFRYQRLLDEGQYASITEMAEAEKLDRGYMGRLLQLTLLAPEIVEAILNDEQSDTPGLPGLIERLPFVWKDQRDCFWKCFSMQQLPASTEPVWQEREVSGSMAHPARIMLPVC